MRQLLAAILAAASLQAATLRGMVTERQTGKPLARALVAVHPVAGSAGATRAARANLAGVFEFPPMPAGAYVVTVSRRGFAPWQYGQQEWKGAGTPVLLQETGETTIRIALPRFGAITGRIADEADVGLVEHDVIAYRNGRPPVMAGKAPTDDRGVFRISGLAPGVYVVRTAAKSYDDSGYLPTFYKETPTVDGAQTVEVMLGGDTTDVNIRPTPGRLFVVSGQAAGPGTPPQAVSVSLISDMGAENVTTDSAGHFRFTDAAPGKYELFALSPRGAGWMPVEIDRDLSDQRLFLYPTPAVEFAFEDGEGAPVDAVAVQVMARRKELYGPGAPEFLPLVANRAELLPGRWEFSVAPNPSYYSRGWTEAVVAYTSRPTVVKLPVFAHPGSIHGVVEGANGVQVSLEHEGETQTTLTDIHGAYTFLGLAPGEYHVRTPAGVETVTVK